MGSIHYVVHGLYVLAINDGVDGEIGLDAVFVARGCYLTQVVNGEVIGRMGTHVKLSYSKIHGIGTGLYGGCETLS